jgi:catechol 2,3-dioxygenase-like lactoylglutathione lyase family enzyme
MMEPVEALMLKDPVIQAIITTAQPDKSKTFYTETLGLKLLKEDQFGLVFVGKIGVLRVAKVAAVVPAATAVLGFMVEDVAQTAKDLAAKGVKFERYAFLQQDELGLWTSPDGAKIAWFRDPDFNLLSISPPV